MIEDQSSANAVDPPASEEDPAGGVVVPLGHRAVIRAQILAGTVVGLSTIFGVLNTADTSSFTK